MCWLFLIRLFHVRYLDNSQFRPVHFFLILLCVVTTLTIWRLVQDIDTPTIKVTQVDYKKTFPFIDDVKNAKVCVVHHDDQDKGTIVKIDVIEKQS